MNILFLADIVPYPPNTGLKMRTFNVINQLSLKGHRIYLMAYNHKIFINDRKTEDYCKRQLEKFCEGVYIYNIPSDANRARYLFTLFRSLLSKKPYRVIRYRSEAFIRKLRELIANNHIDLLHLDKAEFLAYDDHFQDIPAVATNHNVESLLFKRRVKGESSIARKFFAYTQYLKTRKFAYEKLNKADNYITVSQEDAYYLRNKCKIKSRSFVVENGVDTKYYQPSVEKKNGYILIIGAQSKEATANYDASIYFFDRIWPRLLKMGWQGDLKIVGRNPDPKIIALGKKYKNIQLVGFVEDERDVLGKARLLLVPLRIGGGSRLKILTAFSMKTAVISTSIGAEGIRCTHGKDIIIADTAIRFAESTYKYFYNDDLREIIEENGRKLAKASYDWEVIGKKLSEYYRSLTGKQ